MKQHSVNCIPAALYAVTGLMEELTDEKAEGFIDSLFTELEPDLAAREEIRSFLKQRYSALVDGNRKNGEYKQAILDYLQAINGNSTSG